MMRRGGVAVLAAIWAVAACGPVGRRPPAGPGVADVDESAPLETMAATGVGESVRLHFAWPHGLEGRCRSRRRVAGAGPAEPERALAFRVRVERQGDEVRIVTDDVAGGPAGTSFVEIVEPDGRYRAAHGVEDAVEALRGVSGEVDTPAGQAARSVEAQLAQTWKLLVGAWAGRQLPLGATYAASAPEALPGGESVRMRIAIQADGRVPCRRGAASAGCVRVRLSSQPEEPAPQALVPSLLAALGPGIDARVLIPEVAAVMTSAVVVTEPDTLIPHRFTLRRRLVLRGRTPDEPHLARERAEEITRVCAWR